MTQSVLGDQKNMCVLRGLMTTVFTPNTSCVPIQHFVKAKQWIVFIVHIKNEKKKFCVDFFEQYLSGAIRTIGMSVYFLISWSKRAKESRTCGRGGEHEAAVRYKYLHT